MFYEFGGLTSFPVGGAEATTGERDLARPSSNDGKAWIDYRGPPGTFRNVSFSRVLHGKVPASVFRGKTVVIGATAPSLQDLHATSTTGDELMSGPEVQANAIWTAIHGFPLSSSATVRRPDPDPAASPPSRRGDAAAEAARPRCSRRSASASLYAVAAQLAFDSGTVLPFVYPLLALVLSALGALAVNYLLTSFERQRVHDTFARFVPEAVVADVLERVDDGGPPLRRRAARVHGAVQRPARLHQLRRGARARTGDRSAEPLPGGDERRDHGRGRHPRRLHGRRDHGRLRRADRAGGPRRPRPRGGARDAAGAAAELQRVAARRRASATGSRWGSGSTAAR